MEGVVLDCLKNENTVREFNPLSACYSYLSEDNNQDEPHTNTHMMNTYQNLVGSYII